MPIWNWYEILKTGDLKHLFISGKGRVNEKIGVLWDQLQDEYIYLFGLDEKFTKRIKLLKKKAILNYEYILTKDRFINTKLAILEADLEQLNSGEAIGFYSLKDHLEKYKGFRIDPKEFTVIEWHTALKNMSNG
jgi:hypothetical protein